jgi:uncharacterized membrane protein YsdA (DUF1294 family)/cold shock CspA family protein
MAESPTFTARIVEWNADLGYGYVEHNKDRVILHVRDFAERRDRPEVGDRISFSLGTDPQGRTCAKGARQLDGGGRLKTGQAILLAVLLLVPVMAIGRNSAALDLRYTLGYLFFIQALTYGLYWIDKRRARAAAANRIPESGLHLAELTGGWPAAYVAQRWLRHKSSKISYQIFFWLIVVLHEYAAIDYLLGGTLTHQAIQNLRSLLPNW